MVSRRKPNWIELIDGPWAGKRVIAQPDGSGCFEVEKYDGIGVSAVRALHRYRMEPDVWVGPRLKRKARWSAPSEPPGT